MNPRLVCSIQPWTHVQFVGSLSQVHNHVVSLNYGSKSRLDQWILNHFRNGCSIFFKINFKLLALGENLLFKITIKKRLWAMSIYAQNKFMLIKINGTNIKVYQNWACVQLLEACWILINITIHTSLYVPLVLSINFTGSIYIWVIS